MAVDHRFFWPEYRSGEALAPCRAFQQLGCRSVNIPHQHSSDLCGVEWKFTVST
ncbi:MAG: hypothetical protein ACI88G_000659, partial [Woeseiaceae bacterium]